MQAGILDGLSVHGLARMDSARLQLFRAHRVSMH